MKVSLIWICVLWLLISCGKADANVDSFDGTYVGYYLHDQKDTMQVSFLFEENHYTGFREKKFCPILGKGTFEQEANRITFEYSEGKTENSNEPVLSGEYLYEINADGSIRMWKKEDTAGEEYILRKSNDESLVYGMTNTSNDE